MKHLSTWFASILIASALLLNAARSLTAASHNPRPKKHQESADKETQTAKPLQPEPTVPSRNLDAAQAATLNALSALHAEQEAHDKDKRAEREAFDANLISLGLLVVGIVYSYLAWKHWAAISVQAKIANDALIENRKAADAAKQSADAATQQMRISTGPKIEVYADTLVTTGTEISVYYTVVNIGQTDAKVLLQRMSLWRKYSGVPWPSEMPSGDTVNDVLLPVKFEARDRRSSQLKVTLSSNAGLHPAADWEHFISDNLRVCLSGHFLYTDEFGTRHETFFCQAWTRIERKFTVPESMPSSFNHRT